MNDTVLPFTSAPLRAWMAVLALGVSAFAIVTSELAPIGMLTPLAKDLGQTEANTGLVVAAYGWIAAVAALLSGMLPARWSRRLLLVGLMLVLALSGLASSQAASLTALLGARMVGAVAHGVFWAMVGSVAAQLVPASRIGLATAVIFSGVSAASVLGVPLTNLISGMAGWRSAFAVIAVLALITAVALLWTLPELKAPAAQGLSSYRKIIRSPVILLLYLATASAITAHFAAFTYLEPLLTQALAVPAASVTALMLVSGVSGLAGNIIAGKLIDTHLKLMIIVSLLLASTALWRLGMPGGGTPVYLTALLLAIWGAGISVIFVGFQTWLLRVAGDDAPVASAIYVAIFNAAIGTGALAGGLLLAGAGLSGMMRIAAVAIILSLVLVTLMKKTR